MVAVPISSYLERKRREKAGVSANPTPLDIQAATEVWYEKGFREGMTQAQAGYDAELARRQEEYELRVEATRKSQAETEGAALARQIEDAVSALKADIADAAARILRPVVAQKLIGEALAKLSSEIEKLLSHDDAINLKISGPAGLVLELRKRIPPNAAVTVLAGEKHEVTVFADKTVIETRLGEWLERIGVDGRAREQEFQGQ
jgi:hypothetical protein